MVARDGRSRAHTVPAHFADRVDGGMPSRLLPFLGITALVMSSIILFYLGVASLLVTGSFHVERGFVGVDRMQLASLWDGEMLRVVIVPLISTLILLVLLFAVWKFLPRLPLAGYALILAAFTLTLQIVWVVLLDIKGPYPYADSLELDRLACAFLQNDAESFSTEIVDGAIPYLVMYPFQSGGVILFALVYLIFGTGNQLAFMVINAVANTAALISVLVIVNALFKSDSVNRCCLILECLFLPITFSVAFVYCNSIGLGFAAAALALNVCVLVSKCRFVQRVTMVALSFACMLVVLWVKSTFILILFGIVAAWVIYFFARRKYLGALIPLLVLIVLNQLSVLPTAYLQDHFDKDFGDGMPKVSWIAMGMREDNVLEMPGWWGFLPSDIYKQADGDVEKQSELALNSIKASVVGFMHDPVYALQFFGTKLASEWLDPTYQSLYYSGLADDAPIEIPLHHIIYSGFNANRAARMLMDGFQSILYLSSAVGCVLLMKRMRSLQTGAVAGVLALAAVFIFGFGCYFFWEAKSVYVLPFALLLVPFSAVAIAAGCSRVDTWLCRFSPSRRE